MAVEATGAARWQDFFLSRGELPLSRGRYRTIAMFRLIAILVAIGPTQLWMRDALTTAHAPDWGRVAVTLHLVFMGLYLLGGLALLWCSRAGSPDRPKLWSLFTLIGCAWERGTNQAYLLGFGSLAN